MPSTTTVLLVTASYLVISLVVGMWPGRRSTPTAEGYVAGDRSMGLLLMYFITGATIFSAFAFLGGPGWAFSRGAACFYILGYGAIGFMPFYFLGPRAARVGRAFHLVTQAEMVSRRFDSPATAGVMALVSTAAFLPYLAIQMTGAGYVVETVTGGAVPFWGGAALVYGVVLAYVWRSGVLGIGWTNTLQGLFMMVLAWSLGLYLPTRLYGGIGPMFERIAAERPELLLAPGLTSSGDPWSWSEYSSTVFISIIGFTAWPHLFMKAFTAASETTIRRTVILYPTFQIFLVPLFLIGFAGVFFDPAPVRADQILPHMLMHMDVPAILVGLFCAGALAASMSSGDAMAHASASILVRDGLVRSCGRKMDAREQRRIIRWMVLAVLLAAYVVTLSYKGSLVQLLIYAYGGVVQFTPLLVATLYWSWVNGRAALTGLIAGSALTAVLLLQPEWRPIALHAGLYGLVANVFLLIAGSLLWPPPPRDSTRHFLAVARGEVEG